MVYKVIPISELIKRDTVENAQRIYQIQGKANESIVDVTFINNYKFIPIVTMFDITILWVKCEAYSYMICESDFMTERSHKMCGLLLNYQNQYCGSLNYVFVPNEKKELNNGKTSIDGHFEIQYEYRNDDDSIETKIIIELSTYSGQEESIHILANTLLEHNILEYAKNKVRPVKSSKKKTKKR